MRVGGVSVLHPIEVSGRPHGRACAAITDRGHLNHLALDVPSWEAFEEVPSRVGAPSATDGAITDLGPKLSFWFVGPSRR